MLLRALSAPMDKWIRAPSEIEPNDSVIEQKWQIIIDIKISVVLTMEDKVDETFLETSLEDLSLQGFVEGVVRDDIGLMDTDQQEIYEAIPYWWETS